MRLADLEHIIRASCQHLGQDQIIIIGSQSILGTYNEYELPDESTMSVEADVVPIFDDANESQSTFLDGGIGEFSPFHQLHGYYAQGVGRHTATLPENWLERLVPVSSENTGYFTGWCLDVHDLCSAKLIANRDKDRAFVAALIEKDLVSVRTLKERVRTAPTPEATQAIVHDWLAMWDEHQPNYQPPSLPHVPEDLPDHPARVFVASTNSETDPRPKGQRR